MVAQLLSSVLERTLSKLKSGFMYNRCMKTKAHRNVSPVLLMVLVMACGKSEAPTSAKCVPGHAQECPCDSVRRGVQVCQDDGKFAACECDDISGAAPKAGRVDVPDPPRSSAAQIIECPSFKELLSLVRAELPAAKVVSVSACAVGRFPEAGWYVDARSRTHDHRIVLRADIRALTAHRAERRPPPHREDDGELRVVVDLDGDGVDEMLTTIRGSGNGVSNAALVVYQVADRGLEPVGCVCTEYDDAAFQEHAEDAREYSAIVDVTATDATGARPLLVVGTLKAGSRVRSEDPTSDVCESPCLSGRHEYVLEAGRLAKR